MEYKLILGDCLEQMKSMSDQSIDVVFTSPPYNDSGKTESDRANKRHFKYEECESREDWYEWQVKCIDQMLRVSKRQVLYNIQPILSNKADVYRLIGHYADRIDQILIWYKPNAQPQHYPHRISNCYEVVLDPFMGLATTGLSCLSCGRKFVGIEIHEPYYRIAQQRMDQANSQISLFEAEENHG